MEITSARCCTKSSRIVHSVQPLMSPFLGAFLVADLSEVKNQGVRNRITRRELSPCGKIIELKAQCFQVKQPYCIGVIFFEITPCFF